MCRKTTVLLLGFFLLFFVQVSTALCLPGVASWKAVWDANPEPDVAGYYLYWRAPGGEFSEGQRHQVEGRENVEVVLDFIPEGSWEIAVTAYDQTFNESDFSNVVSFTKDNSQPGAVINLKIQLEVNVE